MEGLARVIGLVWVAALVGCSSSDSQPAPAWPSDTAAGGEGLSWGGADLPTVADGAPDPGAGPDTGDTVAADTDDPAADTGAPTPDAETAPLVPCVTDADCPLDRPRCAAVGYCVECLTDADCAAGGCHDGSCTDDGCSPGETRCEGNAQLTCNEAGTDW